jgi:hypothetical protein
MLAWQPCSAVDHNLNDPTPWPTTLGLAYLLCTSRLAVNRALAKFLLRTNRLLRLSWQAAGSLALLLTRPPPGAGYPESGHALAVRWQTTAHVCPGMSLRTSG